LLLDLDRPLFEEFDEIVFVVVSFCASLACHVSLS